jgi:hypothetical protein
MELLFPNGDYLYAVPPDVPVSRERSLVSLIFFVGSQVLHAPSRSGVENLKLDFKIRVSLQALKEQAYQALKLVFRQPLRHFHDLQSLPAVITIVLPQRFRICHCLLSQLFQISRNLCIR